jgi:hypothetical protein
MTSKIWLLAVLISTIFLVKKCTERWTGIVYFDKSNLSNFKNIGEFKSLEECRNEAIYLLRSNSSQSSGDFECGLNCNGLTCEETSR